MSTSLPPEYYFAKAGVTATTVGLAKAMYLDDINGFTFHNDWNDGTGGGTTLAGTFKVEASNDPALEIASSLTSAERVTAENAAKWQDITALLTVTDVTSGAGDDMIIINNSRFGWIRLTLTKTGGTGACFCFICSHGEG